MDEVKKRSFTAGYLMGLAGMPVAAAPVQFAAEPTMCLYGGTPLPYLRWDKQMYPKALVTYNFRTGEFILAIYRQADYYQVEVSIIGGTYTQHWFGSEEENTALVFSCKAGDTSWSRMNETSYSVNLSRLSVLRDHTFEQTIWASFDLMFADGTQYVAESEPEPIRNPSTFNNKVYYSYVVLSHIQEGVDLYHKQAIMKHPTEDAYILYDTMLGGFHKRNDEVYFVTDNIYTTTVRLWPADGSGSHPVNTASYVEERINDIGQPEYFIGPAENLIWVEETMENAYGGAFLLGGDPVPVVIPESQPGAVNDNKLMMLGCRLGYVVRSQTVSNAQ